MTKAKLKIEFLVNPFCLCDRDYDVLTKICSKHSVRFNLYNLWDIRDEDVDSLPEYMSTLIRQWRNGERPGSVYSNVFVNGERVPLNDWPKHVGILESKILAVLGRKNK